VEGGNSDCDGQKRVEEGCGGSVAGVDERRLAWTCTEESEGVKEKRARRSGRLF
jgi:hypothetical protein